MATINENTMIIVNKTKIETIFLRNVEFLPDICVNSLRELSE